MSAKPSAKLSGVRRGATNSKRTNSGPLIIDPNRLVDISVNRDAIQALTLANARIQIDVSPGGTVANLVSIETGKMIGGTDDLAKLLSLRSFVTKEKKSSASSEHRSAIVTAAARLSQVEKEHVKEYKQGFLDNSFVVAAKPYQMMCANLHKHTMSIKENFGTTEDEKQTLTLFCQLTEKVLVDVLAAMVRGEKEKGLLDALSFENKLPAYIRNKLVTKSLALTKDMDLSRILFPADPSKGLSLTVKEWRSIEMVRSLGPLMKSSEMIATWIQDDNVFLELIGMTAEQFANVEDPKVQRVLKTRILVVPPYADHKRILALLEKPNFRGFGLPATAMDQSKDRLANLCAVPLRAYAFSVRMAETIPDFYDRIFPAGTIRAPDEKLGNYAKQASAALERGVECKLTAILRGEENLDAMMAWVSRECKIIPNGDLFKKIVNAATDGDDITIACGLSEKLPDPPGVIVDVVSKATNKSEIAAVEDFENKFFSLGGKNVKKRGSAASSALARDTKVFLKHIKREHSAALADAMEAYFRGFYAVDIQLAAVQIATARFDEFDDDYGIGSSGDESTDDEEE